MANYNIDIGVVIKGNEKLNRFNESLKKTTLQVKQLNDFLKAFQQGGNGVVKSFDTLNNVLATAKANFYAVASGTKLQEKAARQLIVAEKELNAELKQREALLQRLSTAPLPLPGTGRGRDRSPQSFKDRNMTGKRSSLVPGQSLFGQSVTVEGGASGRSRQILQEEQALQEALARMDQRDMKLIGQSVNIEDRIKQALAKQTANRKKAELEVAKIRERATKKIEQKEKKLIELRKKSETLVSQDRIAKRGRIAPNVPTIGSLAGGFNLRSQFAEGGAFAATKGQRV